MNGIILIDKEKGITSRDVVNKISKILNIKKIGHTGTLDPIATGVLVLCVGKYTKLVDIITSYEKQYYASAILGIETDTLDTTGKIIYENKKIVSYEELEQALNNMVGTYNQEVPKYSAVKINGKKMYEYARNNEDIELPKRKVTIKSIKLDKYNIIDNKVHFSFYVTVSKGTYIRSLIKDIAKYVNTVGVMSDLRRIKQGCFDIKDCNTIKEIENNNFNLLKINDVFDYKIVEIDDELDKKVSNGCKIFNKYNEEYILFSKNNLIISLYKNEGKYLKPYKMNLDGD